MSLAASYSIAAIFSAKDKLSPVVNQIEKKYGSFSGNVGSSINKLNLGFNKLAKAGAVAIASVGTAAAGAAVGIFKLSESVATTGDEIAKTSRMIGMSAETLQELRFAADRQGVSSETLTDSLQKLNKSMGDLRGGTGTLTTLLKKTDPAFANTLKSAKTNEQAFNLLMDRINKMPNQFDKASLAQAAFGRSGQDLLKLFEAGPDGIKKLREEAEKLGIVMSTKSANASEEFMDSLTNLKAVFTGIKYSIGSDVIPLFTKYVTVLVNIIAANKELIKIKIGEFFDSAVKNIKQFVTNSGGVEGIINKLKTGFTDFVFAIKTVANTLSSMNAAVNKIGGWKRLAEVLLIVAAATKIASVSLVVLGTIFKAQKFIQTAGGAAKAFMALGKILGANLATAGIIAGISLIIVGIVLLVKNWDKVKTFFVKNGDVILKTIFSIAAGMTTLTVAFMAFNGIASVNPFVLIIAGAVALIAAIVLIVKNWDKVKAALSTGWENAVNLFQTGINKIGGFFKMLGQTVAKYLLTPVNLVMDGIIKMLEVAGKIPGIGNKFKEASKAVSETKDKMNTALTGNSGTFNYRNIWENKPAEKVVSSKEKITEKNMTPVIMPEKSVNFLDYKTNPAAGNKSVETRPAEKVQTINYNNYVQTWNNGNEKKPETKEEKQKAREEQRAQKQQQRLEFAPNAATESTTRIIQTTRGEGTIKVKAEDGTQLKVEQGTMKKTGWNMEALGQDLAS